MAGPCMMAVSGRCFNPHRSLFPWGFRRIELATSQKDTQTSTDQDLFGYVCFVLWWTKY